MQPGPSSAWGLVLDVVSENAVVAYGLRDGASGSTVRDLRVVSPDETWMAPLELSGTTGSVGECLPADGAGNTFELSATYGAGVYLVKRNTAAQVSWSTATGNSVSDVPLGLAVDSQGAAVVAWYTDRAPPEDIGVAKYAP